MTRRRRPTWVYGAGSEPDYRVSLANERTFLAWIRTSVGLLAGGVAISALRVTNDSRVDAILGIALVLMGLACACASWLRWARTERALRTGDPLPSAALTGWLAVGVALVSLALMVLMW